MNKFIRSVFRLLFVAPYVCAVTVYPLYADNLLYEFGPKTDTTLIFTASAGEENQANTATVQLHDLIGKLSSHAPDMHTIVAITKNDVSELPPDIPVKRYEGTKQLIRGLSAYSNPVVCLIAPGKRKAYSLSPVRKASLLLHGFYSRYTEYCVRNTSPLTFIRILFCFTNSAGSPMIRRSPYMLQRSCLLSNLKQMLI